MSDRSNVVSSFTIVKGALVEETYSVFSRWNWDRNKRENLRELTQPEDLGISTTWARDVRKVLNRRFDPEGRDRPLVEIAQRHVPLRVWKPIALWHLTRDEFLLGDFLQSFLFERWDEGALFIRTEDVMPYLAELPEREIEVADSWSPTTTTRVAHGLLKIAADFELLRGSQKKEFTHFHLPEPAFVYLCHALRESGVAARDLTADPAWRMYRLRPQDVDHELALLDQRGVLTYRTAGSVVELTLPDARSLDYARRLAA